MCDNSDTFKNENVKIHYPIKKRKKCFFYIIFLNKKASHILFFYLPGRELHEVKGCEKSAFEHEI
jgi:hypothetical protein